MTQGTNVVNSWKHFERIFVEETLMEYLWARIYGAGDAKSADTLKGNLEAAPHKLSILVPLPQLPRTLSSLPSLLTEIEQIRLTPTAPVTGAIYVEKQILDFYFSIVFICQHLGGFADLTRLLICHWRREAQPSFHCHCHQLELTKE